MLCRSFVVVVSFSSVSLPQDHHRANNDTLAVVGTKVITAERFARLYKEKLVKLGLTDNGETRRGYLLNLVDDEVLIAETKNQRIDRRKESLAELTRIQLQELLNAYSLKHISPAIEPTDNDLRELFVKMNTKIKVSHLYAQTKQKADSLYDELCKGKDFATLARDCFTDSKLRESGGSLGYISIDEMDPDFEKTAYSMHVGDVSRPVKTVEGYSIIKVDDIKQNPLVTESEFLKARERLKGFARKRKYEVAVKQYTSTLRKNLKIRFNERFVSRLYAISQAKSLQYMIENTSLTISPADLKKTVVSSTMGVWNGKALIDALSRTTEKQRRWIHSEENLEDFIAGLMMREYIAHEARREKLDRVQSFHENVEYAFDTFLLTVLEGELKSQIKFSSDSLKSFYEHNKEIFQTAPEIRLRGILVDNAILADTIRYSLEQGASFDELAKQFSIQSLTAQHGGDLGFYRKEDLGMFGKEIFTLREGAWMGPVTEDGKYLFLKCTDWKEPLQKTFEESSKEIENTLVTMAWYDARKRYVDSVKTTVKCRVYPERIMAMSL
jgi:parvulin-like peptidyl-prolyl isomerase